jgi:hypothetical protein
MRKQSMFLWGLTLAMAVLSLLTSSLLTQGADHDMWAFVLIFGLLVILIPPLMNRLDSEAN